MSQATRTGAGTATTGKCTITLQGPGSGSSIIGTVSVVNSPPNARWTITNAGTDVTTVVGSSSYGPLLITGTLPLTLTSTGPTLVNGTAYRATIVGVIPRGAVTLRTLIPQPAPMAVTEITLKGGTIDIAKVTKVTVIETIKAGTIGVANQTGTVIETGNHLVRITTFHYTIPANTNSHNTISLTGKPSFGAIIIYTIATGTAQPVAVQVNQQTPTATSYSAFSWGAPLGPAVNGIFTRQAVLPVATYDTTNLGLNLYTVGAAKGRCIVHGLTVNPGVPMRTDGRTHPGGSHKSHKAGTTIATIVAAPSAPLRILVASIAWAGDAYGKSKGGVNLVYGTQNGTSGPIGAGSAPGGGYSGTFANVPPEGWLMDAGTAITSSNFGTLTAMDVTVTYDLVP